MTSTLRRYLAYSHVLETCEDFDQILSRTADTPDLAYRLAPREELRKAAKHRLLYEGQLASDARRQLLIWESQDGFLVRFEGSADYLVAARSIICAPTGGVSSQNLRRTLLSSILSFWLEQKGHPSLHASAVVTSGRRVAFLASSTGGKSVLAAGHLKEGDELVADDVLALDHQHGEFVGLPAVPRLRLRAALVDNILGRETLNRSVPGAAGKRVVSLLESPWKFSLERGPLAALYLLRREGHTSPIQSEPLGPRESVVELLRHSYAGEVASALPESSRFEFLCKMAKDLRVRVLTYPSDLERLPEVRHTIRRDIGLD